MGSGEMAVNSASAITLQAHVSSCLHRLLLNATGWCRKTQTSCEPQSRRHWWMLEYDGGLWRVLTVGEHRVWEIADREKVWASGLFKYGCLCTVRQNACWYMDVVCVCVDICVCLCVLYIWDCAYVYMCAAKVSCYGGVELCYAILWCTMLHLSF